MAWDETEDTTLYKVVMNHEEQYSIWPAERDNALGWNDVGKSGTKQECLDYIEEVWTDMRPLSLRKQMEAQARQPQPAPPIVETKSQEPDLDPLVQRLSVGNHPVAARRTQKSATELQQAIERGLVHITFTETQGGTELGIRLETDAIDLSQADFSQGTGSVHLVGNLTLNYVKVRCNVDLELATLTGTGRLAPVT